MGSLSVAEILTIVVVILVIFGPDKLPEFSRRLGVLIRKGREAVASFTSEFEASYGDTVAPLKDLSSELSGVKDDLTSTVGQIAGVEQSKPTPADKALPAATDSDEGSPDVPEIAAVPDLVDEPPPPSGAEPRPKTIEEIIAEAKQASDGAEESSDTGPSGDIAAVPDLDDGEAAQSEPRVKTIEEIIADAKAAGESEPSVEDDPAGGAKSGEVA